MILVGVATVAALCSASCGHARPSPDPGLTAIERARLKAAGASGYGPAYTVVDGDVAVVSTAPGEGGFITSIYRTVNGRWRWFAEEAGVPGPCLYARGGIPPRRGRELTEKMLKIASDMRPAPVHGCSP
jgi:hypothetical protein